MSKPEDFRDTDGVPLPMPPDLIDKEPEVAVEHERWLRQRVGVEKRRMTKRNAVVKGKK